MIAVLPTVRNRMLRSGRRLAAALRPRAEGFATAAAFFAGLTLIAYGTALISLPAGLIVGGVLLTAGSLLYARGAE